MQSNKLCALNVHDFVLLRTKEAVVVTERLAHVFTGLQRIHACSVLRSAHVWFGANIQALVLLIARIRRKIDTHHGAAHNQSRTLRLIKTIVSQ